MMPEKKEKMLRKAHLAPFALYLAERYGVSWPRGQGRCSRLRRLAENAVRFSITWPGCAGDSAQGVRTEVGNPQVRLAPPPHPNWLLLLLFDGRYKRSKEMSWEQKEK